MIQSTGQLEMFDPTRWGLPTEAVAGLSNRLLCLWRRFQSCFKTKTHNTAEHALTYLRGLLMLATGRNYVNIARRVVDPEQDGQNIQQFMSDSPWPAQAVFEQIQEEICQQPELRGGMLTVDESGDECAGAQKAGSGRQYLGREGKVDMGQVGVGVGYYKNGTWVLVDAELYMLEFWFDDAHAKLRERWHVPAERVFKTKPELALEMILRAQVHTLPFEVVGCDDLYGRDSQFRTELDVHHIIYMADVPADTQVYLKKPVTGIPETPPDKKGRPFSQVQVLNEVEPVDVRKLVTHSETVFQSVDVRHTERGLLTYQCHARRVWTITETGLVREEWLFIRQEHDHTFTFSLSNALPETPLAQLAFWRALRYFAERIFQDIKSEGGWDELVAPQVPCLDAPYGSGCSGLMVCG